MNTTDNKSIIVVVRLFTMDFLITDWEIGNRIELIVANKRNNCVTSNIFLKYVNLLLFCQNDNKKVYCF